MAMSRKRIREASEELVRRGVVVDSGQRARPWTACQKIAGRQ